MGKKRPETTYYEYYISFDLGLCWGAVDELVQVFVKEKPTFGDNQTVIGTGTTSVNLPDLFGGYEREGGIVGTFQFRAGTPGELLPDPLAERMGVVKENAPGYRDICTLAYHGDHNSGRRGGSVGCNYPNVPSFWPRVRRASRTLNVNTQVIPYNDTANKTVRLNTNPASFLHELCLHHGWGMGGDPEEINVPSFVAAAGTLFQENFGISFMWAKQSSIEDLAQEVLDHINGMIYFNPFTGLVTLKLIRDDYDRDRLNTYGPDTVKVETFKRKLWAETINEVSVTWTNPANEEENSVTYQDPGNIAQQGEVVSVNRNYYMIRDIQLATDVCKRDLQSESAPLASVKFTVDRTQWKELPGDCIKFNYPEYDIENVILRIMDIDWGTVNDRKITVNAVEDIFSFQLAEFAIPGKSEWEDPSQNPDGPDYLAVQAKFFAAPVSLLQQDFGEAAAEYLSDTLYPQIMIGAIVTPIPPTYDENGHLESGQPDLQSFRMWVPEVDTTGEEGWLAIGEKQIMGKGALRTKLGQEVRSTVTIGRMYGGDPPEIGRYAIIGDGDEFTDEWVMFEQDLGGGTYVIRRGVMDTTPKIWPVETNIYFITLNFDAYDTEGSLADNQEKYKLQPRTSKGYRDFDGVQTVVTNRPDRPYRPYRPANIKMNNVMFGGRDDSQKPEETHEPREIWQYDLSWSRRNRFMEENIVLAWDDDDMVPEPGQTTSILVMSQRNGEGDILHRIDGIEGTSYLFDIIENTGRLLKMSLKFISVRDGFESLQGHYLNLDLYIKGFGSDFGYVYGGWPMLGTVASDFEGDVELPQVTAAGEITNGD